MSDQPKKRGRPRNVKPNEVVLPPGNIVLPGPLTIGADVVVSGASVIEGDDAEMSEKEVELLVERMDREAAGLPEPPAIAEPISIPSGPHALDDAPVNSKIVVTDEGAVFATPQGVSMFPKTDPASRLPRGARIVKAGPVLYIASQLSATWFVEPKNYTSAGAAIADFNVHFHPRDNG